MSTTALPKPTLQTPVLLAALGVAAVLFYLILEFGAAKATLFLIGLAMGVTLYHAAFGFTGAYRRALEEKDISGITAQAVMLALAMLLFAPVLAQGEVFGQGVVGAVAPVNIGMAFGAFLFGIGMQLAGGCASGTLFTVGGGSVRMVLVLAAFAAGCFWASLDLGWWQGLPGIGAVSLADEIGAWAAVGLQLAVLAVIIVGLRALGGRNLRPLWWDGSFSARALLHGPWPLLLAAALLALLNFASLLVAGHPWSITWGFTLWGAKAAVLLGWDPATAPFWVGGFQERALKGPLLADTVSVMNLALVLGALAAAGLAGRFRPSLRMPWPALVSALLGGLMLGYGARLAYGCNIGAFFSGVASTSLHGWAWIVAAGLGNWAGLWLSKRLDRMAG
jgi:hypothetical protein